MVRLLVLDEFNGQRGDFYKNMFATCQADRPGTADEAANVPELQMAGRGHSSRVRFLGGRQGNDGLFQVLAEEPLNPVKRYLAALVSGEKFSDNVLIIKHQ